MTAKINQVAVIIWQLQIFQRQIELQMQMQTHFD